MAPQPSQEDLPAKLAELRELAVRLASDLADPLRRIAVRCGDLSLEVDWQQPAATATGPAIQPASPPVPARAAGPTAGDEPAENEVAVSSPMVGTFYRAPSPDAAPFVEVGDRVEPGQTVAIIEAMKLFNPITAGHSGIVSAVLAESGQPVEFGQALLLVAVTELPDVGMTGKG